MFAFSMIPLSIQHIRKNGGFALAAAAVRQAWREGSLRPLSPEHMQRATQGGHGYEDYRAGERLLAGDEEVGLRDGDRSSDDLNNKTTATATATSGSDKAKPNEKLSLRETARLSLEFSMLWFLANYLSSACLQYTSVGSTTILTSTSSVWTLVLCAWLRVESFSWRKLVGVLASLAGIILISSIDLGGADNDDSRGNFPHKTQRQIAIGDIMALVSAFVYGVYVTVMKVRVGDEDRVNMPLFFGLVGCLNIILLWPLFFILHFTGIEPVRISSSLDLSFLVYLANILANITP
jgi:solute carrier family 35, member F5